MPDHQQQSAHERPASPFRASLGGMAVALCGLASFGCTPTVNIATPKPVVIDVNIKADVTTRSASPEKKNDQSDNSSVGSEGTDGGSSESEERPSSG